MPRKVLYFLLFLAMSACLLAGTKGRIKGKVVDMQTGEPLIGANVVITGTTMGAATDVNGEYVILNVDAGEYNLISSYLGYQSITKTGIRVNADLTAYIDFELPSEEISVGTVEIIAKKPLIKKDATSSVRIASRDDIENLPVRGVDNIIAIQAGVVDDGEVHIRGSRSDEVGYYLDGVSVSSAMDGGRGVTISNDAVEEIQVETGGFSVEYGGSNAGIIRSQLRTGSSQFHASFEYITDNVTFQSKDDFFTQEKRLGAYWYGQNEASFTLSGPLFSNKVKFFYNLSYSYEKSQNRDGRDGFDFGVITGPSTDVADMSHPDGVRLANQDEYYTHAGTLLFDLNPISLRVGGTFTHGTWDDAGGFIGRGGGVTQNLVRNRRDVRDYYDGAFNLKMTHVLSSSMFYEVTAGYTIAGHEVTDEFLGDDFWAYGDSVANAEKGIIWNRTANEKRSHANLTPEQRRYTAPANYDIYGWAVAQPGDPIGGYWKQKQEAMSVRADLSLLAGKHHSIKIGGEYKAHTMRRYVPGQTIGAALEFYNERQNTANAALTDDQIRTKIQIRNGVDNYGYDPLGNEVDEDGFYEPKKPVFAAFYILDKIEYEDIILNVGLRYEYFDIDHLMFADPSRPELALGTSATDGTLIEDGFAQVPTFSALSPRISVSFPVTDKTQFYAGFGKYVQQPELTQAYNGYHRLAWELGAGFFQGDPEGANLRPVRKTSYQIGFRQELTDFMAIDISGYYDDVKGQVYYINEIVDNNSPYSDYAQKANGDFSTTKGVEMSLTMRRYERVAINASLSFQDARGTGSNPNSNSGIVGAPLVSGRPFIPQYIAPLTFNVDMTANAHIDYRFGEDDGPAFLENTGLSILMNYNSGHYFTRGTGENRDLEGATRFRRALEPLNSSGTPSNLNVDLKLDKTFNITDDLSANVYVRVVNLFDSRAIQNVYTRTGSADDDGWLNDPDLGGVQINTYGQIFEDLYKAIDIEYSGYWGNARQIFLGVRLEY